MSRAQREVAYPASGGQPRVRVSRLVNKPIQRTQSSTAFWRIGPRHVGAGWRVRTPPTLPITQHFVVAGGPFPKGLELYRRLNPEGGRPASSADNSLGPPAVLPVQSA